MFHDIYKKFNEGGWINCMRDVEVGGQGMPTVLSTACYEFFMAANFPFTMYPASQRGGQPGPALRDRKAESLHGKNVHRRMGRHHVPDRTGGRHGCRRVEDNRQETPDGTYSITGTKIFISSGDHDLTPNIVHPVLARIEGTPRNQGHLHIHRPKYKVNKDGSLSESMTSRREMLSIKWDQGLRNLHPEFRR